MAASAYQNENLSVYVFGRGHLFFDLFIGRSTATCHPSVRTVFPRVFDTD